MVEDAVVIILLLNQRQPFLLARDGAINRVAQRGGGECSAAQIFLRAAENRLGQKVASSLGPMTSTGSCGALVVSEVI